MGENMQALNAKDDDLDGVDSCSARILDGRVESSMVRVWQPR